MLVFLVLCAYIRTLQGAPLVPPHASSFFAAVDLMGRNSPIDPACGGPQCRSGYSIVQSCVLTIFTCVWTSLHPNINGPRDSDWTCFKRKVVMMLCVVIVPEMVLSWALQQRWAAKKIAKRYNKGITKSAETVQMKTSVWRKVLDWFLLLWGGVVGLFLPLSEETTRRKGGQSWTTTHGFFIQMGGFILYDDGVPKQVLDYEHFVDLLQMKAIDAPTVTERDLQDRSKGDAVSKAIIVLQTTWFVFQCIARAGQHLPLSELEVLTLAFAVMNVAIYVAWWDKPQSVGMAICIPLKNLNAEKIVADSILPPTGEAPRTGQNLSQTEHAGLSHSDSEHSNMSDKEAFISPHEPEHDNSAGEKHSWLRRKLREDHNQHSSLVFFLFRLPYRIVTFVGHLLSKIIGNSDSISQNDLRVSMFYASDWDLSGDAIGLASCGVGTIFGAIHLLAWASQFPSPRDVVLWRVSAIVLTVTPFLWLLGGIAGLDDVESTLEKFVNTKFFLFCIAFPAFLLIPLYIIGRFVVIVIALLAIHDPPRDVLRDISWTSYIPHF